MPYLRPMQMPEPAIYNLINRCPQCGERLYAAWRHQVKGLPLADVWSVECDNVQCDYVYPQQFSSVEELARKFQGAD